MSESPGAYPVARRRAVRAALRRYQVAATIAGFTLLLLCVEMVLKYGFNGGQSVLGAWVAIVHGWVYVAYVVCAFLLWSAAGWRYPRLFFLVFAGVIPLASFVMEWRATEWFREEDAAGRWPESVDDEPGRVGSDGQST